MQVRRIWKTGALVALAIMGGGWLGAQIIDEPDIALDASGKGQAPIAMRHDWDHVAGLQGRIRVDPSRIASVALTLAPDQPDSFVLRAHSPEPGETRFVLYSATDTLDPQRPFLHCAVEAAPHSARDGLDEALVVEIDAIGALDAQVQTPENLYRNISVRMAPTIQEDATWLFLY